MCALITSKDTTRSLKTYVEINAPEAGVKETSFILCHHLQTLRDDLLDEKPEGFVTGQKMIEVRNALKRTLDLP